jgi:hypothetical protein
MTDRSSAPQRGPNRTPVPVVRKIVHLRWKQRLGPVEIAEKRVCDYVVVRCACPVPRQGHVLKLASR